MKPLERVKELRRLWNGFWRSRVLLSAKNLDMFDYLKSRKAASEIAKTFKLDKSATEILLYALTGLGLLKSLQTGIRIVLYQINF